MLLLACGGPVATHINDGSRPEALIEAGAKGDATVTILAKIHEAPFKTQSEIHAWTRADVMTLNVKLFTVTYTAENQETGEVPVLDSQNNQVETTLTRAQLDANLPVVFSNLDWHRTYRVRGEARNSAGTVICDNRSKYDIVALLSMAAPC